MPVDSIFVHQPVRPRSPLCMLPGLLGRTVLAIALVTCCSASGQQEAAEDPDSVDGALIDPSPNSPQPPPQPEDSPQPPPQPEDREANPNSANGTGKLRFAFERAPWREVIEWLADSADLAFHVDELPVGSFTYSDPRSYTHEEAIAQINMFLLPQSFTVVRSGRLLSVINLSDPRGVQQLNVFARMVSADELGELNDHEVVKCLFPLGDLDPEDAVEELSGLQLMTTPAVFARTNRLMLTDTATKLRTAKAILDAFEPTTLENGTVMKTFTLEHVDAEDVLMVARPHLGLATDEMIGIDVSLSADADGRNIFVTGVEDKVALIEGLISDLDKPDDAGVAIGEEAELRAHVVQGGDVDLAYDVLQTLLADYSIRLSVDESSGSIVALAPPGVQAIIAKTVAELEAPNGFEVIPLKTVDPYFAVGLLEEMLDLPDPLVDDPEDIDPNAPRIDADPTNMRLFVRAKENQIEQIRQIVSGLEVAETSGEQGDEIRLFPLKGDQARQVLVTAAKFWREPNPVVFFDSPVETNDGPVERVVHEDDTEAKPARLREPSDSTARLLTDDPTSQAPVIRCQVTPRGLLLQSDDTEALDKFYEHLRTIAGPVDATPSPPVVFYLKYSKPEDAIRMLAELLDGGESAQESVAGTLVNGIPISSTTFLGSLVTSSDGTTTMTAGSITVVADPRLNRLIAQGTPSDIERIESYLKIVDKDSSITAIETYGTPHVIELQNTRASEVAAAIREAYVERVKASPTSGQPGAPGASRSGQRPESADRSAARSSEQDRDRDDKKDGSDKKASAGQRARDLEPKMTIAVHELSNSLIVTAPEQLYQEVEQLAKLIDARSERTVRFVSFGNRGLEPIVRQLLEDESQTSRKSSRSEGSRSRSIPLPSSLRGSGR